MLVAAELGADRRVALRKLLAQIPEEVQSRPYYRRIKVGLAVSTGDLGLAESELRQLIELEPRSLELQLQFMSLLFRQNKDGELRREAKRSADEFVGSAENQIVFAQFKKDFGDWQEAHNIAYRTLLANPGDERVNRAYAAIFLFEKRQSAIDVAPSKVAQDMAVGVQREDASVVSYVIDPDPRLRPANTYLSPDHAIAKSLLGKEIGDQLELPDHSIAKIVWIKPKELHSLHIVLEEFNNVFPDAEGWEKVRIDTSSPEGIQPMLDRVRGRADAIASVASKYDDNVLPLSFVARLLGSDPVATALGLATSGHRIRVCHGTELERREALRALSANKRRGCIVDAVTLHFIRRLGLEQPVEAVCGPIGIVGKSMSRIQQQIHELEERLDEPSMSIFYRDGQHFREEITPEHKRKALDVQRQDRAWIAAHAQIIPAEGSKDPSAETGKLLQALGSTFFDKVRAASSSGRMLLSDDLAMRILAETEYGVKGCWLQVVLMAAVDGRHISLTEYSDAVLGLIDANQELSL